MSIVKRLDSAVARHFIEKLQFVSIFIGTELIISNQWVCNKWYFFHEKMISIWNLFISRVHDEVFPINEFFSLGYLNIFH